MCPTMLLLMVAGGGVRARTMLAEASVGGGLVDRCSFWWWERRACRAHTTMAEERLVGSAALPNGAVGCRLVDGVVVVVVGEWCSRLVRRETSGVDERCLRQAAE